MSLTVKFHLKYLLICIITFLIVYILISISSRKDIDNTYFFHTHITAKSYYIPTKYSDDIFQNELINAVNAEFLSFIKENSKEVKIGILENYKNKIISIRRGTAKNNTLIISTELIDMDIAYKIINNLYEKFKYETFLIRTNNYLFCSEPIQKKEYLKAILRIVNQNNKYDLENIINENNHFFICNNEYFTNPPIFIEKKEIFKYIEKAKFNIKKNISIKTKKYKKNKDIIIFLISAIISFFLFLILITYKKS